MRILVLSDIHSNLVALDAVLTDAGPVDAVWHLGDVVGYGPDPNGVIRRLGEVGAIGVRGNHDAAALGGNEIDWFNPDARRAMEWTRGVLDDASRTWLADLPERRTEHEIELVHGSPRQPIWEYILSSESAQANLEQLARPLGLHGHTHVPVAWREADGDVQLVRVAAGDSLSLGRGGDGRGEDGGDGKALLNPGSVGQPRDGIPASSWLMLDLDEDDPTAARRATWRRTSYDIGAVQRAMREAHLPSFLVRRLELGA